MASHRFHPPRGLPRSHRAGCAVLLASLPLLSVPPAEPLRILTWPGYITDADLVQVNRQLAKSGYAYEATVITPYAEGAEQMFSLIRRGKVDIAFLTLFFIHLQQERTSKLIQPINANSPRLSNYRHLYPDLTRMPMGLRDGQPLYIPFCGGAYGFYIDRSQVPAQEVPRSWADLLAPKWKGRYSLNRTQVWYNVAIASIAQGNPPYFLNQLALNGDRGAILEAINPEGPLARTLTTLYRNAGAFWSAESTFAPGLQIVSSWGIEVRQANKRGGNWQRIRFREGDLVWLDTINFVTGLKGRKLEAAEILANHFIGKEVQTRVARDLSLVAVSRLASPNPVLDSDPQFFSRGTFVPPYHVMADNAMTYLSNETFKRIGLDPK